LIKRAAAAAAVKIVALRKAITRTIRRKPAAYEIFKRKKQRVTHTERKRCKE